MKRFHVLLLVGCLAFAVSAMASKAAKKTSSSTSVDAGSFGIFVNGQRVATEHFKIDHREGYSITTSELKMEDGSKAAQHAELEIMDNGDLRKYSWNEVSPGYIGGACGQAAPNTQCKLEKSQFGVFIPRQQAPSSVTLEYKGREKVDLKGAQRELEHFDLTAEGLVWSFYVDPSDSFKLVRVAVPTEKTEIVRD